MRPHKKTEENYNPFRNVAFIFTILYFMVCCILIYNEKVRLPDIVQIISALLLYLFPIVLLLCWYMCGERYMTFVLKSKEKQEQKLIQKQAIAVIAINVYWGIGCWGCLLTNIFFLVNYGIQGLTLVFCYGVILLITLLWFGGLLMRHRRFFKNRLAYFLFALLSLIIQILVMVKADSITFIGRMNELG